MIDLNFPTDYATRLLGYDLFTLEVKVISSKLGLKFEHQMELAVVYDIIARQYLNALDVQIYDPDVKPLFYLQLKEIRSAIPFIVDGTLTAFPCTTSPDYIGHYYEKEISILIEHLGKLPKRIRLYQQSYFRDNRDILISFIESFLIKTKPDWMASFYALDKKSQIGRVEALLSVKLEVGDHVEIVRPYVVRRYKTWNVEKLSVFSSDVTAPLGICYFDTFSIKITDKHISSDNRILLVGETNDRNWMFMSDIKVSINGKHAIPEWFMCHGNGSAMTYKDEPVPFYKVDDLYHVNKIKGDKLTEYQLKCLMTDAEIRSLNYDR